MAVVHGVRFNRRLAVAQLPLFAAGVLTVFAFETGFRILLAAAAALGFGATLAQHFLYEASGDTLGKSFEGLSTVVADLRAMPAELPMRKRQPLCASRPRSSRKT